MKTIKHIIISVLLFTTLFLTSCTFTGETSSNGKIKLYVTIENNQVVFDKEVEFYEGEYLIDVLNRHLDVELGSGSTDGMIMAINGCVAPDDFSYYYKLILNCEYASYGACDQTLNDGDSIMILYSELSDYSTGC
jgi:hypothetical protein